MKLLDFLNIFMSKTNLNDFESSGFGESWLNKGDLVVLCAAFQKLNFISVFDFFVVEAYCRSIPFSCLLCVHEYWMHYIQKLLDAKLKKKFNINCPSRAIMINLQTY